MHARRILIVDDDESIRDSLLESISALEIEAETAESRGEAVAMLSERRFDLVLLDVSPAGVGGMEVLREVSRRSPDVPVILITAQGDVEKVVEAMRFGVAKVVQKPFAPEEICSFVLDTLDRDAQERITNDTYQSHLRLAKECLARRRLPAAVEHARRALAVSPSQAAPFNILGVAMQLRLQIAEAQKFYRSALALNEGFAPARKNLENLSGYPKDLSHFEIDE